MVIRGETKEEPSDSSVLEVQEGGNQSLKRGVMECFQTRFPGQVMLLSPVPYEPDERRPIVCNEYSGWYEDAGKIRSDKNRG
jgi:hypothetical protein